jgi:hypothetical protein
MIKYNLFLKEIILLLIFISIVYIEFYLINIDLIYYALLDGIIAFFIGIYILKSFIKKIKINQ